VALVMRVIDPSDGGVTWVGWPSPAEAEGVGRVARLVVSAGRPRISSAVPWWTDARVCRPIPEWRCCRPVA
jgi:hypothetical protein